MVKKMLLTDKISKYCSYGEAIHSDTASRLGIPNIPNEEQLQHMKYVATEILDKIRDKFGPIHVNSFFRSEELNKQTPGASKTSQHMKGEAIDHLIIGRNMEIFKWVYSNKDVLDYDQCIFEYGTKEEPAWVHVSKVNYRINRKQTLRYYLNDQKEIVGIPFDLF